MVVMSIGPKVARLKAGVWFWCGGVAPAPRLKLFGTVALTGLGLIEAGEVAVVPFVEAPVPAHWDPRSPQLGEGQLSSADGPDLEGGVDHVGKQTGIG